MYKGKRLGTFGDVAAMSWMSGKSFAAGELGILVTDNRKCYERAIAYAHYERNNKNYITESTDLHAYAGIALGGVKGRANQLCSALARVQLKYYDERCKEIRKAMNYFWDLLEGVPGIGAIRVDEKTGSNMAGWYCPHGRYYPEQLGGLSVKRFCEAVRAEGAIKCLPGCNAALHTHPVFKTADAYGDGVPTRIANSDYDVRKLDENLADAEQIGARVFRIPWLKKYIPEQIEEYANAFKKVIRNYEELLEGDPGNPETIGAWYRKTNVK
jgi:dTDP-4-amino-4,6-dideoxygalactose transaminase